VGIDEELCGDEQELQSLRNRGGPAAGVGRRARGSEGRDRALFTECQAVSRWMDKGFGSLIVADMRDFNVTTRVAHNTNHRRAANISGMSARLLSASGEANSAATKARQPSSVSAASALSCRV
jgi:hypothetical protein